MTGNSGGRVAVSHAMIRVAVIGLALLLVACGSQPDVSATPVPVRSVSADDKERARQAVDAFLAAMADPEVTYRVDGELRVGHTDQEGFSDVLVNTRYDVKGNEYGGQVDIHLRDPNVGGWFQLIVLEEMAHLHSSNLSQMASRAVPDALRRPDALRGLTADDLTLLGMTDEGLFEFAVGTWLGGDPLGEWVDVGAVPEESLPHTEIRSHDTRLVLDEAGVPVRLVSSFTSVIEGGDETVSGTIVEEIAGLGLYVTLSAPQDMPVTTSIDVIVGVDEDHTTIREPWVEVRPADGGTATLDVVFPPPDEPMLLGIEGAIGFIRSNDADGRMILDRIVALDVDTIEIPAGDQTLVAYYRSCSGGCAVLDEHHDFCEVEARIDAGARYELTVEVLGMHRAQPARCTLEESNA